MARAKHKQQKRSRGRPANPTVGNVDSIIQNIHIEEDKMDVEVVKKLGAYYKTLRDIAEAKGKFEKVGIKDQVKAIEYCIDRAETFLDEYYEEDTPSAESSREDKKESSFAPLISLVAECE